MQPNFILTGTWHHANIVTEDATELTLADLCRACRAHADIIIELVSEGVIESTSAEQSLSKEHWRFTGVHLLRAKVALRLHRDLGVNFAGAALALQLMEQLAEAKAKLNTFAM